MPKQARTDSALSGATMALAVYRDPGRSRRSMNAVRAAPSLNRSCPIWKRIRPAALNTALMIGA